MEYLLSIGELNVLLFESVSKPKYERMVLSHFRSNVFLGLLASESHIATELSILAFDFGLPTGCFNMLLHQLANDTCFTLLHARNSVLRAFYVNMSLNVNSGHYHVA